MRRGSFFPFAIVSLCLTEIRYPSIQQRTFEEEEEEETNPQDVITSYSFHVNAGSVHPNTWMHASPRNANRRRCPSGRMFSTAIWQMGIQRSTARQPVDDTTKAVDLTVQYVDTQLRSIFLLMLECKRNNRNTPSSLDALEIQLEDYILFFL